MKYLQVWRDSQVFQFISLHFGLAKAPQVFTMIVKGSEADGPHKGSQTSIPGQLADHGPVSGVGTSKHSDRGRPDEVFGMDNQEKSKLKHIQVFKFVG